MRITCPGCGSVFDVPDRAVPEPGRDVQCAGCGTSWFLLKGGTPGSGVPADHAHIADDLAAVDDAGAVSRAIGRPTEPAPEASPPHMPPQRRVPPEVLAILRAEAETERRARQRAVTPDTATRGAGARHRPAPEVDTTGSAPSTAGTPPWADTTPRPMQVGASQGDGATSVSRKGAAARSPRDRSPDAVDQLGARDRLARLTAAERHPSDASMAADHRAAGLVGTRDGEEDQGLVEDPGAALRSPLPPLLRDLPAVAETEPDSTDRGHLPVPMAVGAQRALVVMQAKRRGFRLGFGVTVGACFGALALYLLSLNVDDMDGGVVIDTVRNHGAQVQAALVDWLRRVVAPALT